MSKLTTAMKVKSAIQIVVGGHVIAAGVATYRGNETWYRDWLMPMLQVLGAETAHRLSIKAAQYKILPAKNYQDPPCLASRVWGLDFSNPVGLAAGFDKQAEAMEGMFQVGFGAVEIGSVTPKPQPGNSKPRVFRLKEDRAVINRYGFNSDGHEVAYQRLKTYRDKTKSLPRPVHSHISDERNMLNANFLSPDWPIPKSRVTFVNESSGVVGVNLGRNKDSADLESDYVEGVRRFGLLADYLVINVSSPNTPGLRAMQGRDRLQQLVNKVVAERDKLPSNHRPPVLVKIAPDLGEQDKIDIAAVVGKPQSGVDGLIVSNTTVGRPSSLQSAHQGEAGGLSGAPLRQMSTQVIRDMYRLTQGRVPIVGVGGVGSGEDVYDKLCAGASLVQLYTAMAYDGPPLITRIKRELVNILEEKGHKNIAEAVGYDFRKDAPASKPS